MTDHPPPDPATPADAATAGPGLTVAVLGVGAVGTRLARQLVSSPEVGRVVLRDERRDRVADVVASLAEKAEDDGAGYLDPVEAQVVVLCGPAGSHVEAAAAFLRRGQDVVSTADAVPDVEGLLGLDAEARERGRHVVVGAGFAPGLTDVLARHAAATFDVVTEVHVAKTGTAGPACARTHHRALAHEALDWRDGGWVRRPGGSGRELCWFPDPIGAQDCYRGALPDGLLLVPAFPSAERVTARMAATRRDRFTARLPMLRPPHAEGGPGAVRVEVRGRRGEAREAMVLGVMDRPSVAAGAVAAEAALRAGRGDLARAGAAGLAELVAPLPFLEALHHRGVRAAVFEGSAGD
jgi:hypothetical protein